MTKKVSGKKTVGTSATTAATNSAAAGDLKKVHGDWQRSSVNER